VILDGRRFVVRDADTRADITRDILDTAALNKPRRKHGRARATGTSSCQADLQGEYRIDEARELGRLRGGEQFRRRSFFPDSTLVHEDDRVGAAPREAHLVRDQHHRHSAACQVPPGS
jgi:hypothetical protein